MPFSFIHTDLTFQGIRLCCFSGNSESEPAHRHPLVHAHIRHPILVSISPARLCILRQVRPMARQRRMDLPCLCFSRSWPRPKLSRDKMEFGCTRVDNNEEGTYRHPPCSCLIIYMLYFRPTVLKKPTAYALCPTFTAAKEISSNWTRRTPRIQARIRSTTNETPIPYLPSRRLRLLASHTPHPANHHSAPSCLPRASHRNNSLSSMTFTAATNSIFPSHPSLNSLENMQRPLSSFSKYSVSLSGVWTNIGITACLPSLC